MTKMDIRGFRSNDAEILSSMIRKCLVTINNKDYSKKVISKMCNKFSPQNITQLSKTRRIYVAVEKLKLIGTASLKKNRILSVFVDPDLHKQGIGRKLVKHLEITAIKEGYNKIEIPSNTTALKFYEKLGYKKIKKIVSAYGIEYKMIKHI
ncbi:GNAT family N-acetyltransferase [Candidatus Woesearchaeota archaeon]|nr:GNAT family N-acetyltransferase [Candidatus Woesearchaeota archaeon]